MKIHEIRCKLSMIKGFPEAEPILNSIKDIEGILKGDGADSNREELLERAKESLMNLVEASDYERIDEPGFKIDIHTHGKVTLFSKMREKDCRAMIEVARKRGMNGLVFTEHLQYVDFFSDLNMIKGIAQEYGPEFFVLAGGEVRIVEPRKSTEVSGGGDVIVIGQPEVLERLNNQIYSTHGETLTNFSYSPNFDDLIKAIERVREDYKEEFLVIPTHICREDQELYDHKSGEMKVCLGNKQVTGIDTPVKDIHYLNQVRELAARLNKPVFHSSDAHTALEVGSLYTVIDCLPGEIKTPEDVIHYLVNGKTREPAAIAQGEINKNAEALRQIGYLLKSTIVEIGGLHRPEPD